MRAYLKALLLSALCLGVLALGLAQERILLVGLAFNPVGPEYHDGRLNIFSNPRVREAMNLLVDRARIVAEIYGGTGTPWLFPLPPAFLEGLGLRELAAELSQQYAPDPEKGKSIIFEELRRMGAVREADGWYYKGRPVTVRIVAREEDERKALGTHLAELLKGLSLRVEVSHKPARDFSALVMSGNPWSGQWDIATDAWSITVDGYDKVFETFYTPRGMSAPLWQAYKPASEFDAVAQKLARKAYANAEERKELVAQALRHCLQDSVRIWLLHR